MAIKYMCDRCGKEEGTYEMPDGWYWCLGCYSAHADWTYEMLKDRAVSPSPASEVKS